MSTFISEPGTRLGGRYRLEDRVSATSGWAAWKAIDETLARAVTVLTFARGFPRIGDAVTAARAASRLTDARLAQVFDVEEDWDHAYVVMEWVAGDSLEDLLADGPLDPGQGAEIIAQGAEALAVAHAAGVAHLCLTPDSLRWTAGGGVKIVGVGIDVPADRSAERFRERYAIEGPYFLYVGRIVESKQCGQLFDAFARWQDSRGTRATLVLMGHREMPVPERADIRLLGRTSDEDKFDALAGCVALLQPSLLESLSMIALEAWGCGRPVICDARSPVVWGMTYRAGAGLAYRSAAEFAEIGEMLIARPQLASRLGAAGQSFVERTYTWPRVVETYLDLFAEVRARNA